MKKSGSSLLVSLVILLALVLGSCPSPFASTGGGNGAVIVGYGQSLQSSRGPNRTVVADFLAGVDTFRVTLKDSSASRADISASTTSTSVSVTFESVPTGTWDVLVEALAGTDVIASASLAGQVVADNSVNSWAVGALSPVQASSGTLGSFSLAISLPASAGITGLDWRLENSAGGSAITSSPASFTSTAGYMDAVLAASGLAIGQYSLVMEFHRGSAPAGIFREAVNIWGGLTSDKWVNPADGTLLDKRTFAASEFLQGNAVLSALSVIDSQSNELLPSSSFASSMSTWNAGLVSHGNTIAFTPTQSVPGQNITYSWNSQTGSKVLSGQNSRSCALVAGSNTLVITVTAPDRVTTHTYTVTFSWVPSYTSPSSAAMEMVQVLGGSFTMGDDSSINPWMKPAHTVSVSTFLMGKYEVTQGQYSAVMGVSPSGYTGPDQDVHPVETLVRNKAYEFCNKLSELEGLEKVYPEVPTVDSMPDLSKNGYRLPTDAEWEYAARGGQGGSTKVYPGSNTAADVAVYGGASESAPVGSKAPNELGIFDLAGNVSEFCDDWINQYNDGSQDVYPASSCSDPVTPVRPYNDLGSARNTGVYNRSLRGGGYDAMDTDSLKPAYREPVTSYHATNSTGFRVVRGARPLLSMVDIPGGTEPGTGITLPAFKMGATEVTQGQFQVIMGYSVTKVDSSTSADGDDIPARSVSFYDALMFCNKLSVREGLQPVYTLLAPVYYGASGLSAISNATVTADFSKNGYRLPTQSERAWAVRGGTSTAYYWGDTVTDSINYEWTDDSTPYYGASLAFMPVGRKLPNPYGLYDISGNVYEWCWGSDNQNLMVSKRCGGTSRNPGDSTYMSPLAIWDCSANCGPGYYDNGFRVVRGVRNDAVAHVWVLGSSGPTNGQGYWRDLVRTGLADAGLKDIAVNHEDVSLCGTYWNGWGTEGTWWDKGVLQSPKLISIIGHQNVSSIFNDGTNTYVCGTDSDFSGINARAVFWVNGVRHDITNYDSYDAWDSSGGTTGHHWGFSRAEGIWAVSANKVFIAGSDNKDASYGSIAELWTYDGTSVSVLDLSEPGIVEAHAIQVAVDGSHVVVLGEVDDDFDAVFNSCIWESHDGGATFGTFQKAPAGAVYSGMTVSGVDVYVCGSDSLGNARYWKNGLVSEVLYPTASARDIRVLANGDVYVCGNDTGNTQAWLWWRTGKSILATGTSISAYRIRLSQ